MDFKFTANDIINENRTSQKDIDEIKNWLITESAKHVPTKIQDELIVLFLLSCDNDLELTRKTIKAYYKFRKECPDIFDERKTDRKDIQKALNTMRMVCIPVRTDDNDAIIYFSMRDTKASNFELLPVMKASYMLLDVQQLQQEGNPPDSIIYLVDMEGLGPMHLTKLRPDPINKYFSYLGEGLPTKFKAMHFLNSNFFLDKLLSIVSMFLNADVMKRLHTHQPDLPTSELAKFIPRKCLPRELGGDLESQEELAMKTIELLKNNETFWDLEEKSRK